MSLGAGALVLSCILFLASAVVPLALRKQVTAATNTGHILAVIASLAAALAGVAALTSGSVDHVGVLGSSIFGEVSLRLDSLSGFFLVLIGVVSAACALYAPRYLRSHEAGGVAVTMTALYALLVLSIVLVVTVDSIFGFLLVWEAMSILSYFFVVFDHRDRRKVEAGYLYLVVTHIGTACLVVAMLLLGTTHGFDIEGMRQAAEAAPQGVRDAVFVLALIGFGAKAGLVPLHLWLPEAHPAAPSHISALMSGVMLKTAIYGLLRLVIDVLGAPEPWWGMVLVAVGAISAVLGVLYALMEDDLKRLLAYSSVENMGIITLGLGASVLFSSAGLETAALLSLVAALVHTMSHAMFKAVLFLGAGSVLHATGRRDLAGLGGLAGAMRWTSVFFLLGVLAVTALPPLNGFVGEWMTFQGLLAGVAAADMGVRVTAAAGAAALALTGGLAAATFVKAFGIAFLGRARSPEAEAAVEVPGSMLAGMGALALACVLTGVLPAPMVAGAMNAASSLLPGSSALVEPGFFTLGARPLGSATSIAPLLLALALGAGSFALWVSARRGAAAGVRARAAQVQVQAKGEALAGVEGGVDPTGIDRNAGDRLDVAPWACGLPDIDTSMQYSGLSFSKTLRTVFRGVLRPRREITVVSSSSEKPYWIDAVRFRAELDPLWERLLYRPVVGAFHRFSEQMARVQTGNLRTYLAYIVAALVFFLVVTR